MSEETPKKLSLRLSGDGINIEREIDQRTALQIVQVVMGGGAPAAAPMSAPASTRSAEAVTLSLREYLDKIGASKKPDQITTIAQFVCEIEGQGDFSREDDSFALHHGARTPTGKLWSRLCCGRAERLDRGSSRKEEPLLCDREGHAGDQQQLLEWKGRRAALTQMALKDLVAKKSEIAESVIEGIVSKYVRYYTDTLEIGFTPDGAALSGEKKALVYLVAILGWRYVTDEPPAIPTKPADLEKALGIPGGSLRPFLKEVSRTAHLIASQTKPSGCTRFVKAISKPSPPPSLEKRSPRDGRSRSLPHQRQRAKAKWPGVRPATQLLPTSTSGSRMAFLTARAPCTRFIIACTNMA